MYDFTLQVTDASGFVVTRLYTLVVAPPLSITTAEALPTAAVGLAYSTQLVAAGGAPPYVNWVVTTGSLPPGIALNAATGLLSGTPTTTGSFAFLVQVRDSANQTASKGFTLVVNAGLSITTTAQPPTGTLGTAYTFALAAAGGTQPYTWSVATGSLPSGLSLNTTTGAITGTPTAAGSTTFTIEVKDAAGQTARAPYTIGGPLRPLHHQSHRAAHGHGPRPYTVTFLASGGTTPYANWRIISGSVPAALVLNAATGVLSGAPAAAGDFSFTIAVNDATARTVSKAFTLTVLPPGLSITTPAALPAAIFGSAYSVNLQADGGTPPYRWLLTTGTLPAGLTLASGGALSGTPTVLGSTTFGLTVIDSNTRSVTRDFTLAVTSPALPSFTLAGPADTVEPGTQPRLSLELAAPYPSALSGAIVITFTPDTVNTPASPADDPALQFANGSRTLRFSIPAGSTAAEFESTAAFQTGTVAGTITLTPSFTSGGTALSGASPRLIRILRSAPALRAATVTRTASGFDVAITGFATPREVTQAVFRFTAASGANLQTTELTIPLSATSATWFSSDSARAFGSQFTYRQPFTLAGDTAAVSSLSVTLSNSVGASQPVTANVP
ncbi:MAG: putative Ig domain-containing protein [Bryobacterales bacterium]|nr:putative Ig domain-containing protein [Bryobacterales bacterium]